MILVSRLLAAIFVLSAATEIFSPYVSPCKALSESHWASNFHQASLGTNLNLKLLSSLSGMQKVQDPIDVEGFCLPGSSFGLLPVDSILEGLALGSFLKTNLLPNAGTDLGVPTWLMIWPPSLKGYLEENFSSSSMRYLEDTKDYWSLWWTQRNSLDQRLSKFLRGRQEPQYTGRREPHPQLKRLQFIPAQGIQKLQIVPLPS